jgi:hypothetical protein
MKINNANSTTAHFVGKIDEAVSLVIKIFEKFRDYTMQNIENVTAIKLLTNYITNDAKEINKLQESKTSIEVYDETAEVVKDAIKSLDRESIETLKKWQRLNSAQSYSELKAAITNIDNSVIFNISSELSNIIKWTIDNLYNDNDTKKVMKMTIEIVETAATNSCNA